MEDFEPDIFNEEHSAVTVKDRLSKYVRNWPVFAIALAVCLAVAFTISFIQLLNI